MLPATGDQHGGMVADYVDIPDTSFLTNLIKQVIDERMRSEPTSRSLIHQQILDCLRVLPPKSYGDTSLNDNSNAILGDVYQFYNSDNNSEQQHILQNLQKTLDELCQRQDDRDAQNAHSIELLKKSKTTASSSDGERRLDIPALRANLEVERHPNEVLEECEAIAIARQFLPDLCIDPTLYLLDLDSWACAHASRLLLVQAESIAEDAAKDSAVKIIRYLKEAPLPIAWYLSDPQALTRPAELAKVLQTLISQLIDLISESQLSDLMGGVANEKRRGIREDDLIHFFRFILKKLPRCFLILEAPSQNQADTSSQVCTQQLVDVFTSVVQEAHLEGRALKILMVHQEPIKTATSVNPDFNPTRVTFVLPTPMPLARARLQAIRMHNDLVSILERTVLIANERT